VSGAISIETPASPRSLDEVRGLLRNFLQWQRGRNAQNAQQLEQYFDAAEYEEEVRALPGEYAAPGGALLLARVDGEAAGCVALRRLDERACEMKRMFVQPRFQRLGLGRMLGAAVIQAGRAAGYALMRLDTSVRQTEAQALYAQLGFARIAPYYDMPPEVRDWLVFMELAL
jgi:GNAT superfamily N-acetyltransferase